MIKLKNFYLPLIFSTIIIIFFILVTPYSNTMSKSSFNDVTTDDDITFYVASDIHYISKYLTDKGEAFETFIKSGDGKQLDYVTEIFDIFIDDVKSAKPDFLIISGDLTLNGEKQSHSELSYKLDELRNYGIQTYVIPGNHDINNPWARAFKDDKQLKTQTISKKDFSTLYNNFGYKDAISKDKSSLSYLVPASDNLWLLMLDDNKYNNNLTLNYPEANGYISEDTTNWIASCGELANERGARIIVVSHHNILNHSEYVNKGFTIDNNKDIIDVLKKYNITFALSGHVHFQSIKNYESDNYKLYEVASSSLSTYPQKYGVVNVSKDGSLSYDTHPVNMSKYNNTFNEFARKYYSDFIYNQNFNNFSFTANYSNDEIKAMCETLCNIRLKYDDKLDQLSWSDITSSTGFTLLQSSNSPYIKHYIKIADDGDELNNNSLKKNF